MTVTEQGNLALYPSQGQATAVTTGIGDLDHSMSGAYRANPAKDPSEDDGLQTFIAAPTGHFKGALITHNGDPLQLPRWCDRTVLWGNLTASARGRTLPRPS